MEITYFEVYLKDGTTFDFDYKCNKVDYGKGDYIVCIHKEKDNKLNGAADTAVFAYNKAG